MKNIREEIQNGLFKSVLKNYAKLLKEYGVDVRYYFGNPIDTSKDDIGIRLGVIFGAEEE